MSRLVLLAFETVLLHPLPSASSLYSSVYSDSHPRRETRILSLSLSLESLCKCRKHTTRDDFRCFDRFALEIDSSLGNVKNRGDEVTIDNFFSLRKKIFTLFFFSNDDWKIN